MNDRQLPDARPTADRLRRAFETNLVPADLFAPDADFSMYVPGRRIRIAGSEVGGVLTALAERREFSLWDVRGADDGFVVEYAYRAAAQPPYTNVGLMLVTLRDARIVTVASSCAGDWSDERTATVVAETGPFGARQEVVDAR